MTDIFGFFTELPQVFSVMINAVMYFFNYFPYYIIYWLDFLYSPIAIAYNSFNAFMVALLDLFTVAFSWMGTAFLGVLSILFSIYAIFFAIKLFILLKEIIGRWV